MKKQKPKKETTLKIEGTFSDVLKVAVKDNPKPPQTKKPLKERTP